MCEHHHCEVNKNILKRVALSIIFFIASYWFQPLFIVAYLIAGYDVLYRAIKNIVKGQVFDENFLMGLATIGAICIEEYPEAVMVMVLYQIGEFLQHKAVSNSRESIKALMDIRPDFANLNGEKVPPNIVKIGDIITVKTGEKIPLDGIIVEGSASIDTSALTGEIIPQIVSINDNILSGCINLDGHLSIKVTKEFGESTVSKILKLVEEASHKKAKAENFITKFAKYYTPTVVILALIIAFVPSIFWAGNWIERALTFLVISCPCALVISIPLSFFAGIGKASKKGILIKGSNYIEGLSKPDKIIFDKTGTLTKGIFEVTEIVSDNPDLLKYAAYAESISPHPIAKAIINKYGNEIPHISEIKEISGKGIEAQFENKKIKIGNYQFIGTNQVSKDGTIVYVSINDVFQGYIVISDTIKEESKSTINKLKQLNIKTEMLTGDTKNSAQALNKELEIEEYYAELLPKNKVEKIEESISSSNGKSVIFVGDGINDAPVLSRADIGIAMGALGSDAAIEAADVVIMDDNISKVIDAIKISRKTMKVVKQNIIFVLTIKFLFLTLGSLGLMTMWGAVFADVGVSLLATLNALTLIKK